MTVWQSRKEGQGSCKIITRHQKLGHFHGLYHLFKLFGIGNEMYINWNPGENNSKAIGVRVKLTSYFIPMIKNRENPHPLEYMYRYICE